MKRYGLLARILEFPPVFFCFVIFFSILFILCVFLFVPFSLCYFFLVLYLLCIFSVFSPFVHPLVFFRSLCPLVSGLLFSCLFLLVCSCLCSLFSSFFCSFTRVFLPPYLCLLLLHPSSVFFSLPLIVRGVSLAFIKLENATRSPPDNEATDHCYCRSNALWGS
jgi:hypothetical protein